MHRTRPDIVPLLLFSEHLNCPTLPLFTIKTHTVITLLNSMTVVISNSFVSNFSTRYEKMSVLNQSSTPAC